MDFHDAADLEKYKGKLAGKIVLVGPMRPTPDLTEPLFKRYTDKELAELETYPDASVHAGVPDVQHALAERRRVAQLREEALKLLVSEGAAAVITPTRDSPEGGGTGIIFDDNGANLIRGAQTR
jgi:carboxypeptidase Q